LIKRDTIESILYFVFIEIELRDFLASESVSFERRVGFKEFILI